MSLKIIAQAAATAPAVVVAEDRSKVYELEAIAKLEWFKGQCDKKTLRQLASYHLILLTLISSRFKALLTSEQEDQLAAISSHLVGRMAELSPAPQSPTPLKRSLAQVANNANSPLF